MTIETKLLKVIIQNQQDLTLAKQKLIFNVQIDKIQDSSGQMWFFLAVTVHKYLKEKWLCLIYENRLL